MWSITWTEDIPIYLFFNKGELFTEKLDTLPMNLFFLDYTGTNSLLS